MNPRTNVYTVSIMTSRSLNSTGTDISNCYFALKQYQWVFLFEQLPLKKLLIAKSNIKQLYV